jgi:putative ABC transport system permease protein
VLGVRHAVHHWGRTGLLAAFLGVALAVPLAARVIIAEHERGLRARAEATPVVIGARTSRFDLAFNALSFRAMPGEGVRYGVFEKLIGREGVRVVPLHARHAARGVPIVGTDADYAALRGLVAREGRWPGVLGEAALGARAARVLGVGVGGVVVSDPVAVYDVTAPPAIELTVVGVLDETGTADDGAVFLSLQTAWLLDGLVHGHVEASGVTDPSQLVARGAGHVALSGGVAELERVTEENLDRFHAHGGRGSMPLTALIAVPESDKARTMLMAEVNAGREAQAIEPGAVVDEVMGVVLRVRGVLDAVALVLGACGVVSAGLVLGLAWRIRAEEIRTLREIGCSRAGLAGIVGAELVVIVAGAVGLGAGLVVAAARAGPWLMRVVGG